MTDLELLAARRELHAQGVCADDLTDAEVEREGIRRGLLYVIERGETNDPYWVFKGFRSPHVAPHLLPEKR